MNEMAPLTRKRIQAKHLDEAAILAVIHERMNDGRHGSDKPRWVMRHEIEEAFPDVPWKVLLAKMAALIRRGICEGCACGCRGDFYIKDEYDRAHGLKN